MNKKTNTEKDGVFKLAVKQTEAFKIKGFDSQQVWKKINSILENLDKRIMSWFVVTATSFTLLVAAGLEHFSNHQNILNPNLQPTEKAQSDLNIKEEKASSAEERTYFELNDPLIAKSIVPSNDNPEIQNIDDWSDMSNKNTSVAPQPTIRSKISLSRLSINGAFSWSNAQNYLDAGLTWKLHEQRQYNRLKNLQTGLSIVWLENYSVAEVHQSRHILPAISLSYEMVDPVKGNGWGVKSSYIINPNRNIDVPTCKFDLYKKFNQNFSIGPHLLFGSNFKSVFPGLTLHVSS